MEWQPIETAPKDGSELLLYYPAGRLEGRDGPGIDDGGAIAGWWFSSPKRSDDGWETVIGFVGEPTHWMELAPAPTEIVTIPDEPAPAEALLGGINRDASSFWRI